MSLTTNDHTKPGSLESVKESEIKKPDIPKANKGGKKDQDQSQQNQARRYTPR
jgi:hypothetical protein